MIKYFNVKTPLVISASDGYDDIVDCETYVKVLIDKTDTDRGSFETCEVLEVLVLDAPKDSDLQKQARKYIEENMNILDF